MAAAAPWAYSGSMFNAKRPIMKKVTLAILLLLLSCMIAAWITIDTNDLVVTVGDSEFDGPFGAVLGTLLTGGVFALLAVVMTFVALLLALVMAGVGVLVIVSLALAAVVAMAAVSPLLLPLLIPFAIYWLMKRRHRKPAEPAAAALEHAPA
jgi:hypothetical protein